MIRLAAFDIAGTTIDDRNLVYEALRDAVRSYDVEPDEKDVADNMGREKHRALEALLRAGGQSPDEKQIDEAYERFTDALRRYYDDQPPVPVTGVEEAMTAARKDGMKICLTTGFTQDIAHLVLDKAGWKIAPLEDGGMIDALVTADEVPAGRPAPYMIFRAMERTGVEDVAEVLVAGDTTADELAGHRAGVAMNVGVLTGATGEAALADQPHTHILPSVVQALEIARQG